MGDDEEKAKLGLAYLTLWALVVAIASGLILLFSPGILFVAVLKASLHIALDKGQMWTFSILSSVLFFSAVFGVVRRFSVAKDNHSLAFTCLGYFGVAFSIVVIGLICYFGFHVQFFARAVSWLYGWPRLD